MAVSIYTALSRQSGLKAEFETIANNMANSGTTGFKAERLFFSEFVRGQPAGMRSVSMTDIGARQIDLGQGALRQTGGMLDFAIEGAGFFQLESEEGTLLTRAGSFAPNLEGELVTPDGRRVLDAGGAPVFLPPNAVTIAVAADGTLSADGTPLARLGLVLPEDPVDLRRAGASMFRVEGAVLPAPGATLQQGFLEASNVSPMAEMARMIEVQRRYETTKSFVDREHDRIKKAVETMGR